ncbi:MAG: 6,7-dimethyl-8-ribityllumazine synthase [Puniceicoccaceae bacterium]
MSFDPGEAGLPLDGAGRRIGIVAACYNRGKVDRLAGLVGEELLRLGVAAGEIAVRRVPGSMEIPFAVARMAGTGRFDALIGLGVVIAGDTAHHEVIGYSTAASLQRVSIDTGVPVVNGILVVDSDEQADARLGGRVDRGAEFARAAVALANFQP